jgi:phosphoribosylaminoimidazole-succinocarboxamide synthase
MSTTMIRRGSAKDILRDGGEGVLFKFRNTFSAFDVGACPQEIPGKGKAVCSAAVTSFRIAEMIGIPTCFIEEVDNTTIRVQELAVISDRPLNGEDAGCIVPAEWISRFRVSGSLLRGFEDGTRKPTDYGFLTNDVPLEGTLLPVPIHQWTTKWESEDRELSDEDALALCGLTIRSAASFWRMIDTLNGAINLAFHKAGYVRLDDKVEVGLGPQRQLLIADVFGTQDEDRPASLVALGGGIVKHHGKEYVRQELIEMGYFAEVKTARASGAQIPPYPELPESVIKEASHRYRLFAEHYSSAID